MIIQNYNNDNDTMTNINSLNETLKKKKKNLYS